MSAYVVYSEPLTLAIEAELRETIGDEAGSFEGATYNWIADPEVHLAWPVVELADGTAISSQPYTAKMLGWADPTLRKLRRAIGRAR